MCLVRIRLQSIIYPFESDFSRQLLLRKVRQQPAVPDGEGKEFIHRRSANESSANRQRCVSRAMPATQPDGSGSARQLDFVLSSNVSV
jgi:hypothetical protein